MFDKLSNWLDQGENYDLLEIIREDVGYGRDVNVSEQLFDECNRLEISKRTYVDKIFEGAKVYRDDKPTTSLHVTDFRDSDKDGIGAHVEYFNPEYHPLLHLLDVIIWHLKHLFENREEKEIRP
jgi:hypothetical protein